MSQNSSRNLDNNSRVSSSSNFSTVKLKEMIENEVFDILSGIKEEIQNKMKQVDRNINLLRTQINELKKSTARKSQSSNDQSIQESFKILLMKVQKIEKEMIMMKNSNHLNDVSYLHNGEASKSHIGVYKVNQQAQKSNSKQKNNSPLFKKSQHQTIDISSLIFQDDKSIRQNSSQVIGIGEFLPGSKTQKKTSIFSNPISNLKKPPLPSSQSKPKVIPSEYSTSSSFYDQIQNYGNDSRKNAMMNQTQPQGVEKELSKNKNVFMRKKKSQQKIESPPIQKISTHRFENQLQDFGQKQDESFNIELQYSKDTFLSDL